ncbi:hypothetical protein [Gluconobacter morbifer]|uniref:Uncharacterized protein n=1 Tax=Gluconobacter morbifer G707 TaxID=1088869 RepID=G6XFG7_9PROT|nr:hypothetical protein [Gluconobacter morbifer]EHH68925.1 hypothetical protein GMO_02320 [Gluconobacter morbifer G707]
MLSRLLKITLYGTITSTGAAYLLSRRRSQQGAPGINCTAHWLYGDDAAKVQALDLKHSAVGAATNAGAVYFWAWFYNRALGGKFWSVRGLLATLALGPVSALVDYKATPKRFTPGWELVFSKPEMCLIYLAMVLGMSAGALSGSPESTEQ